MAGERSCKRREWGWRGLPEMAAQPEAGVLASGKRIKTPDRVELAQPCATPMASVSLKCGATFTPHSTLQWDLGARGLDPPEAALENSSGIGVQHTAPGSRRLSPDSPELGFSCFSLKEDRGPTASSHLGQGQGQVYPRGHGHSGPQHCARQRAEHGMWGSPRAGEPAGAWGSN